MDTTDYLLMVRKDIEVGSRVKLSGSNLRGKITQFLPPVKGVRKNIEWVVVWDNGHTGICNTHDLDVLND